MRVQEQEVAGWGHCPVYQTSMVYCQAPPPSLPLPHQHWLARGAGRSYGDASLNPGGSTLPTAAWDRMLEFCPQSGVLRCEAGLRLRQVLDVFGPRGWFLAVTPGTSEVTMGGAFAFDVHGKNHAAEGAFSRHVQSIELLKADGTRSRHRPDDEVFRASAGGMGLTGILTEIELRLTRLETPFMWQRIRIARDLGELLDMLARPVEGWPYDVAWLDSTSKAGRGVLMTGRHARPDEVKDPDFQRLRRARRKLTIPPGLPSGLLNPVTIRAFNQLYFRRHQVREGEALVDLESYFYPLDAVRSWNRLYGRAGFMQYQFGVPLPVAERVVGEVLHRCREAGCPGFLGVLKRLGEASPGPTLSFPAPGITLCLDLPARPGVRDLLDRLDATVIAAGGRIYLAKDARLSAKSFRAMYPQYESWREVKRALDPEGRFSSALSRRLEILP